MTKSKLQYYSNYLSFLAAASHTMRLFWLAVILTVGGQAMLNGATLATDKPDYVPGQYVTFTGAGWSPGETVVIDVYETTTDPFFLVGIVSAVADSGGNISNSDLLVEPSFLGQGFSATAMGQTSGLTATTTFTDSGGAYTIKIYAADPKPSHAPYLPTYQKLQPSALTCPTPNASIGTGRAADPLANAVAYAYPFANNNLDALTSLDPTGLALGQIVPFEVQIAVSGDTTPENGKIQFVMDWATYTTGNDAFGFDKTYGVYCAFVDIKDPGTTNLTSHTTPNAKVDSYTWGVINPNTTSEQIEGTFTVSGLVNGDNVIVEIWVVLMSTIPTNPKATGNVQTTLASAQTVPPSGNPSRINTGSQTVSLQQVGQFFSVTADLSLTKTAPAGPLCPGSSITYALAVTNNDPANTANGVVVTDTLPAGVTFVSASGASYSVSGNVITFNVGALAPSQSLPLTVTITAPSAPAGCGVTLVNTAAVTSTISVDPNSANNSATASTLIQDTTAPSVTTADGSLNRILECSDTAGIAAALALAPAATDNCTADPTIHLVSDNTVANPTCASGYTRTRTWNFTDGCGNTSANFVQTITVQDTTRPVITGCPGNIIADATAACSATATWTPPTAIDNCSGSVTLTSNHSPGEAFPVGVTTVTYTATDSCGNSSTCSFTVTVNQGACQSGCTITCPLNVTVECSQSTDPTATGTATCSGANCTATYADVVTQGNNCATDHIVRTIQRTWTCGSATCIQTITVKNTTKPVITVPATALSLQCFDAAAVKAWTDTASAKDTCGNTLTVTASYTAPANNCAQTVTVSFSTVDGCGNTQTATKAFTVSNTTKPVITVPVTALSLQCFDAAAVKAWTDTASAKDTCGNALTVTASYTAPANNCGQTVTVSFSATDSCGNTQTVTKDFTVSNTTKPVITVPATALSLQCFDAAAVKAWTDTASAKDTCGNTLTVTASYAAPANNCGQTVTVSFSATDSCGNTQTATKDFTVNNTTKPVITVPATALSLQCFDAAAVKAWTDTATAQDTCGNSLTVTANYTAPANNCAQTVTVTFSTVDGCGNAQSATKTFTVNNTTKPVITVPATALSLQCFDAAAVKAWADTATAHDTCGNSLAVTANYTAPANNCSQTVTVTFSTVDGCGNTQSATKTFTVNDTINPLITCPRAINVQCDTFVPFTAATPVALADFRAAGGTVSDNCGTVTLTVQDSAPTGTCPKQYLRTFTATDACGHAQSCVQQITCFCDVLMTDTMRCTLANNSFNLVFTPDVQNQNCYKLNASTPGQYYYNSFYVGTPGQSVTFKITVPYPWVTQGAQPIHAYDSVSYTTGSSGQVCLVPGNVIQAYATTVALTNYNPQAFGSTYSVNVTVTVPATGFVFLDMHLDYGLKGTTGYNKNANTPPDAVQCGTTTVLIPGMMQFSFAVADSVNGSPLPVTGSSTITSQNVFKKNPGVGGSCTRSRTLPDGSIDKEPVSGLNLVLSTASKITASNTLATGVSDQDGWYMLTYKWTGKAATLYVTVNPGLPSQIQQVITIKANGYVQVDFAMP